MAKQKETKKPEESQEVAVQAPQSKAVAVKDEHLSEWGMAPQLSTRDTIIPRLLCMQLMSKKVAAEEAVFGELRDSVTNECYASFKKPLEFIPFHYAPVWVESEFSEDKDEHVYKRTVPINAANDALPFEDGAIKRVRTLNFFVLLASDIEAGKPMPKILGFRVTSLRAGRKLATQMFVANRAAGMSPAGMMMKLNINKDSNDKGTFAVLDVEQLRPSTKEEVALALDWFRIVKQGTNIKVDEGEEDLSEALNVETAGALKDTGKF